MEREELLTLIILCLKDQNFNDAMAADIAEYIVNSVDNNTIDVYEKDVVTRIGKAITAAAQHMPEVSYHPLN